MGGSKFLASLERNSLRLCNVSFPSQVLVPLVSVTSAVLLESAFAEAESFTVAPEAEALSMTSEPEALAAVAPEALAMAESFTISPSVSSEPSTVTVARLSRGQGAKDGAQQEQRDHLAK